MSAYRMAKVAGKRVKVVVRDGQDGCIARFSTVCSGCTDDREGVTCHKGSGCRECGYTGRRRQECWVPL